MHPTLEIRRKNSALTVHFHTLVPSAWDFDGSTITVRIPMTWKRRGSRKVIVAPDGGDAWPDDTLIRALARAHRWKGLLEERRDRSAGELAEAESVTRSFVNRLLRLTLLAPDIVEAILEGRPPKGYGAGGVDRVKSK